MEHIPTQESDYQKVYRIARELGISLEDAAVTCDAFHLAFSDEGLRRSIFGMIDELDESAAKKGEPMGLIIRYTVELGMDGIRVGRYADEIPAGEVVTLTPTDRAMILLKIKDNFPTQQFLGPIIMNRPELPINTRSKIQNPKSSGAVVCSDAEVNELPALDRRSTGRLCGQDEGCPVGRGGLTYKDTTQSEIPTELPSHWADIPICLGPIRLKFNERFPVAIPRSQPRFFRRSADRTDLDPPRQPLPWAQLQAGMLVLQSTGLSPPPAIGDHGHSASKDVPARLAIDVETCVSHLGL